MISKSLKELLLEGLENQLDVLSHMKVEGENDVYGTIAQLYAVSMQALIEEECAIDD